VTLCVEHELFLHDRFFEILFCFVCDGWQNEQHVCIKFFMKLSKSATETLEMSREAFGDHSLSWTAVFECIHISRPVECQLKMTKFQGNQAPEK
jgi:hypothetical protein